MSEADSGPAPRPLERSLRSATLLALAILAAYSVSLAGDWLGYDDDWLVRDNELLNQGSVGVLADIGFSFDRETRLILGAEYLPVRDLVVWLLRGMLGLGPVGLRTVALGIYTLACTGLLRWACSLELPAAQARGLLVAVWLFALHPLHAESVAWLAGFKDVLALLFTTWALVFYASNERSHRALALVCIVFGCLSKSAVVITPGLLLMHDLLVRRRPDAWVLGPALVLVVGLAGLHAWVGSVVGMFATPLGDSRLEGVLAIAVVFARYLGLSLLAHPSSLFYEVDTDVPILGVLSLVLFGALLGLSIWAWRKDVRWPAFALGVFLIALAPVSQLIAPLQNRMADRYLFVGLLGPMVLVGMTLESALVQVGAPLATFARGGVLAIVLALTMLRASLFADPIGLFAEGTERTEHNAVAPYMLGEAYAAREQWADAEAAYRIAIDRDAMRTEQGRRAGNNLARLLARTGRVPEALTLYRTLVERYPDDPRVLRNLAIVERRTGDVEAAEAHEATMHERFPDYVHGRERPGPL